MPRCKRARSPTEELSDLAVPKGGRTRALHVSGWNRFARVRPRQWLCSQYRPLEWHSRGQRFDPARLHQQNQDLNWIDSADRRPKSASCNGSVMVRHALTSPYRAPRMASPLAALAPSGVLPTELRPRYPQHPIRRASATSSWRIIVG
jgi:hypothetical protein